MHRSHQSHHPPAGKAAFDIALATAVTTEYPRGLRNNQSNVIDALTPGLSANRCATWKAAENDCLERRNSIRPCVPSHAAYKAERGGNELFWSPWKMYPRSQERAETETVRQRCICQH